ncbi:MAG TPA: GDSL-type esterase/lipase family protein [Candidatus Hydrogenedentes bacterium]|nr:GDSL-type esterase/lipase family protein [Candidatus Hydrogenedentota bacterium]
MNRIAKTAAFMFMGFVWLAVMWLALEAGASVYLWWTVNHNEHILVDRGLKPPPPDSGFSVPETHPARQTAGLSADGFDVRPLSGPDWATPRLNEDLSAMEKRRVVFPSLSESDRDYFAVLHNDLVCVFDRDDTIVRRYGHWRREGHDNIGDFFRQAKKSRETHYGDYHLSEGGLDLPMRIFFYACPTDNKLYGFLNIETLLLDCFARHLPESSPWEIPFFRYKKHLRDAYTGMGTHHVNTNNFGYRGADIVVPKPAGVLRIVCIGGSTTEEGEENATYPKLLEDRLRASFPGKAIEVVNCGVSGMTTVRHLLKLAEYLRFEPDLLVVYEGVNDICHELLVYWRYNQTKWQRLMGYSPFAGTFLNRWLFPSDESICRDLSALTVANMDAIRRAAGQAGVRTVVCGIASPDWPSLSRAEREYLDYRMRGFCAGKGRMTAKTYRHIVTLLNSALKDFCRRKKLLYIPIEEYITGGLYYFSDNCHLRPNGIAQKADIIADALCPYIEPALK